jgi:hypothetical protein
MSGKRTGAEHKANERKRRRAYRMGRLRLSTGVEDNANVALIDVKGMPELSER